MKVFCWCVLRVPVHCAYVQRWRAVTAEQPQQLSRTPALCCPVCVESWNSLQNMMPKCQRLCESHVQAAGMIPLGRLQLRHALSGTQLCIPGVGSPSNGWSFPAKTFLVNDLIDRYVVVIGYDNEATRDYLRVSAVLTQTDEIAPQPFCLSQVANKKGWVRVLTGTDVLPFKGLIYTEKEKADLSGVKTPETPSDSE